MQSINGLFEKPEGAIPPLSGAVTRLMKMPQKAMLREVLSTIRTDTELSDDVLRMADNHYYSGRRPIRNLPELIVRLGLGSVRGLALRTTLDRTVFDDGPMMQRLKNHSTVTAYITTAISQHASVNSETAFHCALLQHIGVAVPLGMMTKSNGREIEEAMMWEALGCANKAIAGLVAETWELPETIRSVLVQHHRFGKVADINHVIATLIIAEVLACELDLGLDSDEHPVPSDDLIDAALTQLDLPASQLPSIAGTASELLDRVSA